jgi:hypothetical protein
MLSKLALIFKVIDSLISLWKEVVFRKKVAKREKLVETINSKDSTNTDKLNALDELSD